MIGRSSCTGLLGLVQRAPQVSSLTLRRPTRLPAGSADRRQQRAHSEREVERGNLEHQTLPQHCFNHVELPTTRSSFLRDSREWSRMVAKRALLVGCNYPGTDAALRGCVNDVMNVRELLINEKGFSEDDIVMMIDTDKDYIQPTGANIRKALKKLAASAHPGDVIYMHYSGHGVEVPPETYDPDDDGLDQCICPTDMNLLTDDDFRDFVNALHKGVTFTLVSDSCHSGGLIEQTKEQVGPKTAPVSSGGGGGGGLFGKRDLKGWMRGEDDDDVEEEGYGGRRPHHNVKNKSLPLDTFAKMLSQKAGHDVGTGNIRTSLYGVFGEDASPTIQSFVGILSQHAPRLMEQLQSGDSKGFMSTFGKMALSFVQQQMNGDKPPPERVQQAAESGSLQQAYAGGKRRQDEDSSGGHGGFLGKENCVLISGCQADETSADVNPNPRDPTSAHGALTYSLLQVMKRQGTNLGYKELILQARDELKKGKFTQHPCLYCGDHMLEEPFITASA